MRPRKRILQFRRLRSGFFTKYYQSKNGVGQNSDLELSCMQKNVHELAVARIDFIKVNAQVG